MSVRIRSFVTALRGHAWRRVSMDTSAEPTTAPPPTPPILLSPAAAILWALAFGLCGGYLDLLLMLGLGRFRHTDLPVRIGRDFPWSVPVSHAVLLLIPGVMIAALNRLRPGLFSLRVAVWLFATLAIWAALLRLPLYGACSLLLAAGLARLQSAVIAARTRSARPARYALVGLLALLGILATLSSGREASRETRAIAGLPAAPAGARNVILIVWDTVRASSLSAYGYSRDTSPNLARGAKRGVRYRSAIAPAPWTYPSHSCFFTGRWPFQLNAQWNFTLDTPDQTLAEYLATRGYQTAGFAANTPCCNFETGLARGFAHFEDYSLAPRSLLGRAIPLNWALRHILYRGLHYDMKWIGLQSRGAMGINAAFLNWLQARRRDRPFFAFLNYFDAHEPYLPPVGYEGRFGIRPKTSDDYRLLFDFVGLDKSSMPKRDIALARDCYDDCIAFLDEQLGRLLGALERQGLLENTVVIITSDHGESFGDHGTFGHSYSVFLDEVGVPLVILAPGAPAGRVIDSPVSLRDLPATALNLAGLSDGSPFPGRSLAAYWPMAPGAEPPGVSTRALSEESGPAALRPPTDGGLGHGGFQMSLVASGRHYIRDGTGAEKLFDLKGDPLERVNLMDSAAGTRVVGDFRRMLLDVLTKNPGSIEAEAAYLQSFRQRLEALISESPSRSVAIRP
jgi:arylsulfatase A-like enzyme